MICFFKPIYKISYQKTIQKRSSYTSNFRNFLSILPEEKVVLRAFLQLSRELRKRPEKVWGKCDLNLIYFDYV